MIISQNGQDTNKGHNYYNGSEGEWVSKMLYGNAVVLFKATEPISIYIELSQRTKSIITTAINNEKQLC